MNPNPNRIRKDDLDALGEMAGLVGAYMNDYAQGADAEARRKLFSTNKNPKETIMRALQSTNTDYAQQIVVDPSTPPSPSVEIFIPRPTSVPVQDEPNANQQMEFNFVQQVIHGYGSVQEVIKHFDERLDIFEKDITIMKSQVKNIITILNDIQKNMVMKERLSQSTGPA